MILKRILLSIGAALLTLTGVELAMRIARLPRFLAPHSDPARFVFTNRMTPHGPLYLNQPGRITFRYDGDPRGYFDANCEVHHDVNPAGFRGPAFLPKDADSYRMVFLGDSFTFGEGVRNEDTYPEVAARLLRQGGEQVDAYNLGVGGYNTSQELDVLKLFGFGLQPDVVILGYTLNDAEPPLFEVDPAGGQPVRRPRESRIESEAAPQRPPTSPLYRLRIVQAIWKARRQRFLTEQTVEYYESIHAPSSDGRRASEHALREIIAECSQREIPCVVVMFPLLYQLSGNYPFRAIHDWVSDVVREEGGAFIDMLPALEGIKARELIVHPTDQHPNENVHAIAGRLVAAEVQQLCDMPVEQASE